MSFDVTEARVGDLAVRSMGAGDPVLLLHGNGESMRVLDAQAAALAARYRVIAMDSRGHGRSGRGIGPLTIARMADDAAAVVDALAAAPTHVIGYSDGANIAMELAVRHPGAVRSLVLISGNLDPSGLAGGEMAAMRMVEAVLSGAVGLAGALPCGRRLTERIARRLETWRLMTRDPQLTPARLGRVQVPALVLVGDRDLIRPDHSRLIAASMPRGRLEVIAGAGHTLIRTHAAAVNAAITRFLASV